MATKRIYNMGTRATEFSKLIQSMTGETSALGDADDFNVSDFRDWLYSEGATESTVDSYTFTARQFFSKYGELNKENLNKYRGYLENNFKVKTVNLRYSGMDKLFKYLNYGGYKFKRLKSQNQTFCDNAISEEQYERLIRYAEANRPRAALLIKVLANTGVRVFGAYRAPDCKP